MVTPRFDVIGTTDGRSTEPDQQLMLQRLLEDRFKLVLRRKQVEGDIYVLLVDRADGRLGPNIKASSAECTKAAAQSVVPTETRQRCFAQTGSLNSDTGWQVKGLSMTRLAVSLDVRSSQTVVDETHRNGVFDFQLRASLQDLLPVDGTPASSDTATGPPSIFNALREQLGLKLERRRVPIEHLVVEHVEMPTPD